MPRRESGEHGKSPVATSSGRDNVPDSYTNLFNIISHLLLSVTLYFLHIKNEEVKDIQVI